MSAFPLRRKPRPTKAIPGKRMGTAYVEVSTGASASQTWRKMVADGKNFQTGKLTRESMVKRYCDELSAMAESGRLCAVEGLKYIEN